MSLRFALLAGMAAAWTWPAAGQEAQPPSTPEAAGRTITNPDWDRRPDCPGRPRTFYPSKARGKGIDGRAAISCVVKADGDVKDCRVIAEEPPGYGFGKAALALSVCFRMKPKTLDGQPVEGGIVRIPIRFGIQ